MNFILTNYIKAGLMQSVVIASSLGRGVGLLKGYTSLMPY